MALPILAEAGPSSWALGHNRRPPRCRPSTPMRLLVAPTVRLFVDIEGAGLVPEGPAMRERPALVLLHGGPGYDHSGFKPAFSRLADIAQIVCYDHLRDVREARERGLE